jgi:hypothetical protein
VQILGSTSNSQLNRGNWCLLGEILFGLTDYRGYLSREWVLKGTGGSIFLHYCYICVFGNRLDVFKALLILIQWSGLYKSNIIVNPSRIDKLCCHSYYKSDLVCLIIKDCTFCSQLSICLYLLCTNLLLHLGIILYANASHFSPSPHLSKSYDSFRALVSQLSFAFHHFYHYYYNASDENVIVSWLEKPWATILYLDRWLKSGV